MSVEPKMSPYYRSPIFALAKYLDQLLRPLFENLSRSTTFFDGADFISKLDCYCVQSKCFRSSSQFGTFTIREFYNNISHSALIRALGTFLVNPLIQVEDSGVFLPEPSHVF